MNMDELMRQAQLMQEEMKKTAAELANKEFIGEAANGLVKITLNGDRKCLGINIDDEILNEENKLELKNNIEALIELALNDALNKIEKCERDSYGSLGIGNF